MRNGGIAVAVGVTAVVGLGLALLGGGAPGKAKPAVKPAVKPGCPQPLWPQTEDGAATLWPGMERTARGILEAYAASRSTAPIVAETGPWRPTSAPFWRWAYGQAGIVALRGAGLQPCIPPGRTPLHLRLDLLADEAQQLLGDAP